MKKKIRVVGILLVSVLCLAGCNKADAGTAGKTDMTDIVENSSSGEADRGTEADASDVEKATGSVIPVKTGVRYAERVQLQMLTEAGVLEIKDFQIHLYTIDEGKDMILCYDPNCRHSKNPEDGCMATLPEDAEYDIGYYEGAAYFFVNTSKTAHRIYKMDVGSAVRELVAEVPNQAAPGYITTFCGDKLYYNTKIIHTDKTTGRGHYTYRLVEVNLLDGSYRFISEETEGTIDTADVVGNIMFTRRWGTGGDGKIYMVTIDLTTLEETVFLSKEDWVTGFRYIQGYDEDSYYYWDSNASEIGIKNIDGTVERILLKGPIGESFAARPSYRGMMYRRTMEYEGMQPGWYFMDIETGEITDITEEWEKYSLDDYDGYYDVFMGDNLAEDGRTIINNTMWSREWILNEAKK